MQGESGWHPFESYEAQDESGNLKVISADTKTPEQTVVQMKPMHWCKKWFLIYRKSTAR